MGWYPDTIDELVSQYGLKYDKQQYIINYYKEADNMLPSIKVYRKEKNNTTPTITLNTTTIDGSMIFKNLEIER